MNIVTLGDRMKRFESVHTETSLIPGIPVYVRIDGRAFHTFTRGLNKPFDPEFAEAMKETTKYLHDETNAFISYVQSDEISLCYLAPEKMPFGTRLFKLESCLAGMASAAFCVNGLHVQHRNFYEHSESYRSKVMKFIPHFDCRVVQLPLEDIPNMLLWRERDCLKNAITLVALEHFSNKQIHKKNSDEKIAMLKEIGVDFNKDIDEDFRFGSWFRRVVFEKELDSSTLSKIPENQRKLDADGKMRAVRSEVKQVKFGMPISEMANRNDVILNGAEPIKL